MCGSSSQVKISIPYYSLGNLNPVGAGYCTHLDLLPVPAPAWSPHDYHLHHCRHHHVSACSRQHSQGAQGSSFGIKRTTTAPTCCSPTALALQPPSRPSQWANPIAQGGLRVQNEGHHTLRGKMRQFLGKKRLISPCRALPRVYLNASSLKYSGGHREHTKGLCNPLCCIGDLAETTHARAAVNNASPPRPASLLSPSFYPVKLLVRSSARLPV